MSIKKLVEATNHSFVEVCPQPGFGIRFREIECPPSLVLFQDVIFPAFRGKVVLSYLQWLTKSPAEGKEMKFIQSPTPAMRVSQVS